MQKSKGYFFLIVSLLGMLSVNWIMGDYLSLFFGSHGDMTTQISVALASIFISAFLVFYLSEATKIPSFIIAVLFGMVSRVLLSPIIEADSLVSIVVGISATLILFSGGLEMPFERFKKISWHVGLLATVGVLLTTLLFSVVLGGVQGFFGLNLTFAIVFLLGAILSSTDPTVLIPLLKQLRFKSLRLKDMIIAESAVTDVTGALLTLLVVDQILRVGASNGNDLAGLLLTGNTAFNLLTHLFFGVVFGLIGSLFLVALAKLKTDNSKEYDVDAAFFLFVPIVIYALANSFGGSGLLAAFIAGLLFQQTEYLHETERFFNHIIDGFIKPTVFILLGAIVPIETFLTYAPIGILLGLVFIFVIRPISVFVSLMPSQLFKKLRLDWRELWGLSAIRETGAVPAVLIMSLATVPGIGTPEFISLGMWVILMTISFPPAFLPAVLTRLGLADEIPKGAVVDFDAEQESFVVLASRGGSFAKRLPGVSEWALQHNIHKVYVLLCLEDKFTPDCASLKKAEAMQVFEGLRKDYIAKQKKIEYSIVKTDGYLHDAIKSISAKSGACVAVFVGKRMLDFHVEEIQELGVPLYFID
jgi:cell volume regulation protein A